MTSEELEKELEARGLVAVPKGAIEEARKLLARPSPVETWAELARRAEEAIRRDREVRSALEQYIAELKKAQ